MSLDDLMGHLVREIAMDGELGSTCPRLWSFAESFYQSHEVCHLDNRGPSAPARPYVDANAQAFLWRWLLSLPNLTVLVEAMDNDKLTLLPVDNEAEKNENGSNAGTVQQDVVLIPLPEVTAAPVFRLGRIPRGSRNCVTDRQAGRYILYTTDRQMRDAVKEADRSRLWDDLPQVAWSELPAQFSARYKGTTLLTDDDPSDLDDHFLASKGRELGTTVARKYRLIVRASVPQILHHLFKGRSGGMMLLATLAYPVLQYVARARTQGVPVVELSRLFGMDPRTTFYICKSLGARRLLDRVAAVYMNTHTTVAYHYAYFTLPTAAEIGDTAEAASTQPATTASKPGPAAAVGPMAVISKAYPIHAFRAAVCHALAQRPNGVMLFSELKYQLGARQSNMRQQKRVNRHITWLVEHGYLVKIRVPREMVAGPDDVEDDGTEDIVMKHEEEEEEGAATKSDSLDPHVASMSPAGPDTEPAAMAIDSRDDLPEFDMGDLAMAAGKAYDGSFLWGEGPESTTALYSARSLLDAIDDDAEAAEDEEEGGNKGQRMDGRATHQTRNTDSDEECVDEEEECIADDVDKPLTVVPRRIAHHLRGQPKRVRRAPKELCVRLLREYRAPRSQTYTGTAAPPNTTADDATPVDVSDPVTASLPPGIPSTTSKRFYYTNHTEPITSSATFPTCLQVPTGAAPAWGPSPFQPVEVQVYRLIAAAGSGGTTASAIRAVMPTVARPILFKVLDTLLKNKEAKNAQFTQFLDPPSGIQTLTCAFPARSEMVHCGRLRQRRVVVGTDPDRQAPRWTRPFFPPIDTPERSAQAVGETEEPGPESVVEAADASAADISTPTRRKRGRSVVTDVSPSLGLKRIRTTAEPGDGACLSADPTNPPFQPITADGTCPDCHLGGPMLHATVCEGCQKSFHVACILGRDPAVALDSWRCSPACRLAATSKRARPTQAATPQPSEPLSTPRRRPRGITSEQRSEVLRELIEAEGVVPINGELRQRLSDALEARYGPIPFLMDLKTVMRAARALEQHGQARLLRTAMPGVIRDAKLVTLAYHPSLTPDSPAVRRLLENLGDTIVMSRGKAPQKPPVEAVSVARVGPVSRRSGVATVVPSHPDEEWLTTTQDLGWISAKMVRARILHLWLIDYVRDQQNMDHRYVFPHGVFRQVLLLSRLPLHLYLQIVACRFLAPTPGEDNPVDYLYAHRHDATPLSELPAWIQRALRTQHHTVRHQIDDQLNVLRALLLIYPADYAHLHTAQQEASVTCPPSLSQAPANAFQLSIDAPIKDLTCLTDPRPILGRWSVRTPADAADYWSQLEFYCDHARSLATARATSHSAIELPVSAGTGPAGDHALEDTGPDWHAVIRDFSYRTAEGRNPLLTMVCFVAWVPPRHLDRAQRLKLDEYIDRATGATPLESGLKCARIAELTELPLSSVLAYYRRIEHLRERRRQQVEAATAFPPSRRRLRSSRQPDALEGAPGGTPSKGGPGTQVHDLELPSAHNPYKAARTALQYRLQRSQELDLPPRLRCSGLLRQAVRPTDGPDSLSASSPSASRERRRIYWNETMDHQVLLYYVVMKTCVRLPQRRFIWLAGPPCIPEIAATFPDDYCDYHPVIPRRVVDFIVWRATEAPRMDPVQREAEETDRLRALIPTLVLAFSTRHRLANRLRHRFNRLLTRAATREQLAVLLRQWEEVYNYGVQRELIEAYQDHALRRKRQVSSIDLLDLARQWVTYWHVYLTTSRRPAATHFRHTQLGPGVETVLRAAPVVGSADFKMLYLYLLHSSRTSPGAAPTTSGPPDDTWYIDTNDYEAYWARYEPGGDLAEVTMETIQNYNRQALDSAAMLDPELATRLLLPLPGATDGAAAVMRSLEVGSSGYSRHDGSNPQLQVNPGISLPACLADLHRIYRVTALQGPDLADAEARAHHHLQHHPLQQHYRYDSGTTVSPAILHPEDEVRRSITLIHRFAILRAMPYVTRRGPSYREEFGNPGPPSTDGSELVDRMELAIKMVLLTPGRAYDSLVAFEMLQAVDTSDRRRLDDAIDRLKQSHSVLRVKTGNQRNIPGRGFNVSEAFLRAVVSHYPRDFVTQARDQQFQLGDPRHPTPVGHAVTRGAMALLLEGLAGGRTEIRFTPFNALPGINQEYFRQAMHRPAFRMSFVPLFDLTAGKRSATIRGVPGPLPRQTATKVVDPESLRNMILTEVSASGDRGCTRTALSVTLHERYSSLQATDVDLAAQLQYLTTHDDAGRTAKDVTAEGGQWDHLASPRLVAVGFREVRYVTPAHLGPWVVPLVAFKGADTAHSKLNTPTNESSNLTSATGFSSARHILPRSWVDIRGHHTNYVYQNCLRAVLHAVAGSPGIDHDSLCRRLRVALNPVEVDDLLTDLDNLGLVKPRYVSRPRPASLFSKSRPVTLSQDTRLSADAFRPCYWAEPDYLTKLAGLHV
ncbi:hypothetical protein IWQ60_002160 [Tieghemiomyces parasiticus]|uniref:Uncharacterized protein n=1 Tax=Tieghemiomyces parasiticus TaxID=78921 RepID=A0A9W8AJX9_9FUNG|nr:hypothetical protein IWQ60_002160 [Tieghemiomyces parasiticus]